MTKYSLRARMMILILAPTLMIGLLLSSFSVVHRYNELHHQLVDAGVSIIEPLAISSEYSMIWHNRDAVRELVSLLHRRHSTIVRAISIFDSHNRLYATSNSHQDLRLSQSKAISDLAKSENVSIEREGTRLILRKSIVSTSYASDETPSEEARPMGNPLGYAAIELDLQAVRLQQYQEIFIATLMLLFSLCIAMLFAYRLMRDVTGPIRNIVNTVDSIRRGQLDSRVEGYMLGELSILKNGINAMAMSLTAYHEEMQQNIDQATCDLRETLEQMEIQNVELDMAKKRAQEAARIKSEFLANMSHELRTPLHGVIGFTRQMLKTSLSAIQRNYMLTIERSANNLLSIINDVLDFSRLESGKLVLESIPFPLRATLDETVVLLTPSAHEKGLELTLQFDSQVPDNVIGDPLRLQQILINLLGNSIKFTERGTISLCVFARATGPYRTELEIQVNDTGIGISPGQQTQLFQAFSQADASISRRHGGTGLGLVITQKLAREMGGEISFVSQQNEGSTFSIRIELELNPHAPALPSMLVDTVHSQMAYVEAHAISASAVRKLLENTPLQVEYSETLAGLQQARYPLLLVGLPVNMTRNALLDERFIDSLLQRADCVLLALPSPLMLLADRLKKRGIHGCITKPISLTRLMPMLADLSTPQSTGHSDKPRLPLRVMAVDDNPANLKLIGALLDEQVQEILLCSNAEQAISAARNTPLHVILMDIQMPQIDGIRASELIRQLPLHANTPIVAVTAYTLDGEHDNLLKAGINEYLAKPIDENKLSQLLARYCAPAATIPVSVPAVLPSLDWDLALRQAAGKPELAREMLTMLLNFLPEVSEKLDTLIAGNDAQGVQDLIHKLHGSASYSGVPRLKQLCKQLESSLRQQATLSDLEPELLELKDELDNVALVARQQLA